MKGDDISREHFLEAIAECDSLGRLAFRKKYGFGESTRFPLIYNDKEYDSKAIVGRAYGLAHPEDGVLAWKDGLSGGIKPGQAGYLLRQRDFEIREPSSDGPPRLAATEVQPQPIHLVVKWSRAHGANTVDNHIAVVERAGSVWWGLRGKESRPKIGAESLGRIRAQLAAGVETKVFLSGPTCWQTSLSGITVTRKEVDEALVPSYYEDDQEHGLWVKLSNFTQIDRDWLIGHLELARRPGVPLANRSLSQTTNPLIVLETDQRHDFVGRRVWWVCQGKTYQKAKQAGVLWAPKLAKDKRDRPYWSALAEAQVGDRVLHYADSHVRAVGTVVAAAVDGPRPFGSGDSWQQDGRLVRVKYEKLSPEIKISEIPLEWRVAEGAPFTKAGRAREGYFFGLSEKFVALMAERFPQLGLISGMPRVPPPVLSSFDLPTLAAQAKDIGLELPDSLLAEVLAALKSDKHVILTGPPGTAKTTLGHLVANAAHMAGCCAGWIPTTATADWTTYDTIGGLRPKSDQSLTFHPGHFLSALESNQWLVIDELNRSNFDRAFGQFFTVLSGQMVMLPHERSADAGPIILLPAGMPRPLRRADVVEVPTGWRIIATMNVFDKTLLFEMSYALMRRFAFIEVPSPSEEKFEALIERWAGSDRMSADVAKALLRVRKIDAKDIGPASYRDIVRYVHERVAIDEPTKGSLVFDAFYSFLLPQFEGIDDRQGRELYGAIKGAIEPTDRSRLISTLNTVLGLELTKGPTRDTDEDDDGVSDALDDDDLPSAALEE
jgi:MoxR-like ATPase